MYGQLYLIPTPLGQGDFSAILPKKIEEVVKRLNFFIVENERTARRFIKTLCPNKPQATLQIFRLEKHLTPETSEALMAPILKGESMGLLSEAGMPCIADPGREIVQLAHQKDIEVIPLIGPSSILLTLVASGLNGQNFAFQGYLPIKKDLLKERIKTLEKLSCETSQTQIFIETPYRNLQLLDALLTGCAQTTLLTIATDLSLPSQKIKTQTISAWRTNKPNIHKRPTTFALQVPSKKFPEKPHAPHVQRSNLQDRPCPLIASNPPSILTRRSKPRAFKIEAATSER